MAAFFVDVDKARKKRLNYLPTRFIVPIAPAWELILQRSSVFFTTKHKTRWVEVAKPSPKPINHISSCELERVDM